jgi:hypothetical protein
VGGGGVLVLVRAREACLFLVRGPVPVHVPSHHRHPKLTTSRLTRVSRRVQSVDGPGHMEVALCLIVKRHVISRMV